MTFVARPGPLGCENHQVMVKSRGGHDLIDVLECSTISYGRKVDDTSAASVGLNTAQAGNCRSLLTALKAWKYELSILRGRNEVWAGPLKPPSYTPTSVTVSAADLSAWFERRWLPHDRTFNADLADIFAAVAGDALEVDLSPNIVVRPSLTGIKGERTIDHLALIRAADLLRELSRTGLDWTMVARELRIGGVEVPAAPLAVLVDDTFTNVTVDPVEGASEIAVLGASAGANHQQVVGSARNDGADIGVVQVVVNESFIEDNYSAAANARTRLDFYGGDPLFVSGDLSSDAPIDFADLVPGARIDLALEDTTYGPVISRQRLSSVDVRVNAAEVGTTEVVSISLAPVGTVE